MFRKGIKVFAGVVLALVALHFILLPSPEEVLEDFYDLSEESDRTESMLANPLRAHAGLVKDLVIREIANKNMRYRRYAIIFLGQCRIREALPALLAILNDETEDEVYRGDALRSIFFIDKEQGLALAQAYRTGEDFLGYRAQKILAGAYPWETSLRVDETINECAP